MGGDLLSSGLVGERLRMSRHAASASFGEWFERLDEAEPAVAFAFSRMEPNAAALCFSSVMFRPRPLISLQSTSNETGVPASRMFSPLTIDS